MRTFVNRAIYSKFKWLYFKLFALRLSFYKMNEDYHMVYALKDEPIRFRAQLEKSHPKVSPVREECLS